MTDTASAWDRYPGYEIALVPLRGVGRVRVGDTVVAESTRCLIVRESEHREQLYFPRNDVVSAFLMNSDHHTTCPFKGEASYADVCVGSTVVENAMWWYPTPMEEVAGLADYAAFYPERVEVSASAPFGDGDEGTVRFPMWGTADDLAVLMDVTPSADGRFTAPPYPNPPLGTLFAMKWHGQRRNVVEGGQLLGAAIVAAAKARPDQRVTSAHMAFVKAASFDEPIDLVLDTRRRGAILSVFDVRVEQGNVLRATGYVMTDEPAEEVIRHHVVMPDVPLPSECPPHDFGVFGREVRVVDGAYSQEDSPAGPPVLHTWTRFAEAPPSAALHQALLAQATTHYSIGAALRAHTDISEHDAHRTISMGPVDASIAFHDDVDVTEWLLTETRSIWAGRGSTQSQVRVFTTDGRLVASKTVQAIVRPFRRTPEQLGQDDSTAM